MADQRAAQQLFLDEITFVARYNLMAVPTRLLHQSPLRSAVRRVRRVQLAGMRFGRWLIEPNYAPQYASELPNVCVGTVRSPMVRIGAHPELERGKRHNVSLACTAIDGLALSPAKPFSFWRTVGPVNQQRGFIAGMELQAGCAVPTIGGGICLLSNALYQLAVEAGWAIVERHGHTAAVAAIDALDATVAYPHVDLRFAPTGPVVLSACVRGDVLVVSAWATTALDRTVTIERDVSELPGVPILYRVRIHRTVAHGGQTERSLISDETRRKLDASQPTCLSCNETSCDDGNRLLQRAGLRRDPVAR